MTGMPIDMMQVDAAQYASISKEMLETGEYLEVKHRGQNYLDKPPLLFWTSALSFKLFGQSNMSYKLFSFLALILAAFSIYRFSLLFDQRRTALLAAIISLSHVAAMLMANDVRTDTLLLGCATFALWQAAAYIQTKSLSHLLLFGVGSGFAMLAKGPIGLMLPISAMGLHLILTKQWKRIFDPKWIFALLVIAVVLFPMCWGLYHQFDANPNATVNGKTGVSGLYFFFWEQSFGRLTGESDWNDDSGYFYFVNTYLWAFIPWIGLLIAAIIDRIKNRKRTPSNTEWYTVGAILIPFIALSFSNYKLPHYIFITLPFTSLWVARYLIGQFENPDSLHARCIYGVQWVLFTIILIIALIITLYVFPIGNWLTLILLLVAGMITIMALCKKSNRVTKSIILSIASFLIMTIVMNIQFYPNLLRYQSSSQLGQYMKDQALDPGRVTILDAHGHGMDFYGDGFVQIVDTVDQIEWPETDFVALRRGNRDLIRPRLDSSILIYQTPDFKVTKLNLPFLDPKRRETKVDTLYLYQLKQGD